MQIPPLTATGSGHQRRDLSKWVVPSASPITRGFDVMGFRHELREIGA